MASFSFIMLWILVFLIFFIGLLIFVTRPKNRQHQYFFGMSTFLSVWMLANYYQNELKLGEDFNIFALELDFATAAFLALFFFLFTLRFPTKSKFSSWKIDIGLFVLTLALSLLSFSNLIITDFAFIDRQISFSFGPLYLIYTLVVFGYFIGGIVELIVKLTKLKGIERVQVLYVMVGCGIAFINGAIINLLLQNVIPVDYFRLGIYGVFFMIAGTAYAILKHHLMDIKVIATESLTFFILLVLLIETLFSNSWTEFILRQLFFAAAAFLSFFLIRSVIKEVEHRKEVQRLAESLRKANNQLKKLDQSKTEFISIASHQLRTPLAVTKGYVSMIVEGSMGKINDKVKEALIKINRSNEHLVHLVETMLNISRIETGRIEFTFKKTDILNFTKNIIGQFEMQIEKKGMNIKVKVLNQLPKYMIFDSDKMGEVFVNLIDNAVKYGQKGDIEVTLENKNHVVEICVIDHGIGINKEDLDNIFVKFKRGVNASATEVGGSGLGLYICRKLTESHGGKIWAESQGLGKGSKLCIHLPKDPRQALKEVNMNEG